MKRLYLLRELRICSCEDMTIQEWLKKETAKAKIARAHIDSGNFKRAQKAEATARVLRKVLKLLVDQQGL